MKKLKPSHLKQADLFGNDAGEEEDPRLLQAVYVETPHFERVTSSERIVCVRSRKGVGKSALLRRAFLQAQTENNLAVWLQPTDLAVEEKVENFNVLVRKLKGRLARMAVAALAQDCQVAARDDLEEALRIAEEDGFRSPDLISRVARTFGGAVEASRRTEARSDGAPSRLLSRLSERRSISLFIDDLDRGWRPGGTESLQLSAVIAAIREIARDNPNAQFRLAIREDVWQMMERTDEQLDKFRQYTERLRWTPKGLIEILGRRIRHFLTTYIGQGPQLARESAIETVHRLFETSYRWGEQTKQTHEVLAKLSRGRPRDLLQLCRGSASRTADRRMTKVSAHDVRDEYHSTYSRVRFNDLVKEFINECPDVEGLISTFGGPRHTWIFGTDEALQIIRSLTGRSPVTVYGKTVDEKGVLSFLFRCGFVTAREEKSQEEYKLTEYDEAPQLLDQGIGFDQAFTWEIHPAFRPHLEGLRTGSYHKRNRKRAKQRR